MNNSVTSWKVKGFIFTGIFGVLLHFLFDWTNQNRIVAIFSAVNESTWEHMKILFFPMIFFSVIESKYSECKNFWQTKLLGIVTGILLIPVIFYTLNGIFGKTSDIVNILIFFLSAFLAYYLETKLIKNNMSIDMSKNSAILILCLIAVLFAIFTFCPPEIPLFCDPISGTYGIQKP